MRVILYIIELNFILQNVDIHSFTYCFKYIKEQVNETVLSVVAKDWKKFNLHNAIISNIEFNINCINCIAINNS